MGEYRGAAVEHRAPGTLKTTVRKGREAEGNLEKS